MMWEGWRVGGHRHSKVHLTVWTVERDGFTRCMWSMDRDGRLRLQSWLLCCRHSSLTISLVPSTNSLAQSTISLSRGTVRGRRIFAGHARRRSQRRAACGSMKDSTAASTAISVSTAARVSRPRLTWGATWWRTRAARSTSARCVSRHSATVICWRDTWTGFTRHNRDVSYAALACH